MANKKQDTLPLAPLVRVAQRLHDDGDLTHETLASMLGTTIRAIGRWRAAGDRVPWVSADRAAIRLGLHPCLVWGSDWWDLVDAEEDRLEADVLADLEAELV